MKTLPTKILPAILFLLLASLAAEAHIIGTASTDGTTEGTTLTGWNWNHSVNPPVIQADHPASWTNNTDPVSAPFGEFGFYGTYFLPYKAGSVGDLADSDEYLGAIRSGLGIVKFDFTVTNSLGGWAGLSFFSFGTNEPVFFGKPNNLSTLNINNGVLVNPANEVTVELGQTYTIIGAWDNRVNQMLMWITEPGQTIPYENIHQLYSTYNTGATVNTKIRIGSGTATGNFNDIVMATDYRDIFGPLPNVPRLTESFSGYNDAPLVGQLFHNLGQNP